MPDTAPVNFTVDLTACPVSREHARTILGEDPVGFRAVTESGPTCNQGCLAAGSSAHSHSTVTGWLIIGTTHMVTTDAAGEYCLRDSTIHPFPA